MSSFDDLEEISNEDIKHLVFREEPEEVKFPIYRSRFNEQVRVEHKKGRECHKTMGYADGFRICPPSQYLKKKSRKLFVPPVEKPEKKPGVKHPPIPKKEEWNDVAPRVVQNYLIQNIRKAVKLVPPTGPSRVFDSAVGKRVHNCNLLIPTFIWSENYGKVPDYIQKIKQQLKEEKKNKVSPAGKENEAQNEEHSVKSLSADEREDLLKSLKKVWADLQREFQVLPMLNDTPPKIKRKEALEAKLLEVEKDIKMIEENQRIFIIQDPDDPRCVKPHEQDPCYQHINYQRRNTTL